MKKIVSVAAVAVATAFFTAITLCLRILAAPQAVFSLADKGMRIVLDAGHGGIDGGVTGKATGVKESDLNLQITMKIKDVLEDLGFDITLTRKTQMGLYDTTAKGFKKRDMQKRKKIIQAADPALVISVHQNFYPSRSSRGAQVFYKKAYKEGEKFALALQETLNGLYLLEGVKGRNAVGAEFFMLECADCPSVIVECGFLSNASDEKLLIDEVFQRRLAETIGVGVMAYFSHSVS